MGCFSEKHEAFILSLAAVIIKKIHENCNMKNATENSTDTKKGTQTKCFYEIVSTLFPS